MGFLHTSVEHVAHSTETIQGIIHRDLKPANCMVTDDLTVKVGDFGESRLLLDEEATMTQTGSPIFIAPEVVRGDHYGLPADVFSFSMTLLCLALHRSEGNLVPWLIDNLHRQMGNRGEGGDEEEKDGKGRKEG